MPVPEFVEVIRYIFEEYIKIPNLTHICRELNEQDVPARSAHLLDNELYRNGNTPTTWYMGSISEIISNPTYMGALSTTKTRKVTPYAKSRVRIPIDEQKLIYDCHEGIVLREVWEKANEIRGILKHHRYNTQKSLIYKGYLLCAHCGKALSINQSNVTTAFCSCWPLTTRTSSRCMNIINITRRLLSDIKRIAVLCEENESNAFSILSTYLNSENCTEHADYQIDPQKIQMRIDNLYDKINNLDKYYTRHDPSSKQSQTILSALEASLRMENETLAKHMESQCMNVTEDDIWQFIHAARRFGYIKEIDREVLEELIDKIYVSKKDTDSWFQQDRIIIKFKHIGVLSTCYER